MAQMTWGFCWEVAANSVDGCLEKKACNPYDHWILEDVNHVASG